MRSFYGAFVVNVMGIKGEILMKRFVVMGGIRRLDWDWIFHDDAFNGLRDGSVGNVKEELVINTHIKATEYHPLKERAYI